MMTDELFLAWSAGFFDGEGSIVIELSKSEGSKSGYRTSLHATVTQTSIPCLQRYQDFFGGSIKTFQHTCPNSRRWSVQYTWSVRNEKALAFLRAIKKYSVVKSEQIDTALQYPLYAENGKKYGNKSNPMPEHIWGKRLELRTKLQDIRASMKTKAEVRHG